MSTVEKIWTISVYEWQVRMRDRRMLACAITIALCGGLIFGYVGEDVGLLPSYVLAIILAVFSMLWSLMPGLGSDPVMRLQLSRPGLYRLPGALAALPMLVMQSLIYSAVVGLLAPERIPGVPAVAGSVVLAFLLGLLGSFYRSSDG